MPATCPGTEYAVEQDVSTTPQVGHASDGGDFLSQNPQDGSTKIPTASQLEQGKRNKTQVPWKRRIDASAKLAGPESKSQRRKERNRSPSVGLYGGSPICEQASTCKRHSFQYKVESVDMCRMYRLKQRRFSSEHPTNGFRGRNTSDPPRCGSCVRGPSRHLRRFV